MASIFLWNTTNSTQQNHPHHLHLLPFTKTRTKRLFYVNKIFAKFLVFFSRVILCIFEEEPHIAAKKKKNKMKRSGEERSGE